MRFRWEDCESQVQPRLKAVLRLVLVAHQDPVSRRRGGEVKEEEEGRQEIIKRQRSSRSRKRKWRRNRKIRRKGEDYCS